MTGAVARRAAPCALAIVLLLTGCGNRAPGAAGRVAPAAPAGPGLEVVPVASQLLVGRQRFPIGVLDHGTPVADALVHVSAESSQGDPVRLQSESDAPYRSDGLEGRGLYVAWLQLDSAGLWLAEITVALPGGEQHTAAVPFRVLTTGSVPAAGQPAPRSHNPTAEDVPDVSDIDSGTPPDDMHAISIANAIAQHRPTLVVFATPAFCTSATCGPQVHAVQQLEPAYRDRLTFIHVEIYENFRPDPARRRLSSIAREWHLQTEPWVFLVDSRGVIRAAFEGTAATDELRQAVDSLLAAG